MKGHVLVVDDDPALLEVLTETLQEAGFEVETAASGNEALERIGSREPDVVVADVSMAGMDGFELCRRVRASGRDHVPFLFCSGLGSADSRVEGLQAGADDYLVKPVEAEELILKLTRQVGRARRLREASAAARASPVNAATLTAIEARLRVQGQAVARLGRFEVRAILGRGAMGTVFKAWDTKLERWVAIKTVRAGERMTDFWDGGVVRGLVAEAALVARFNHPHVVAVHDVQDASDAACIVMEFVDGPSLEDVLRRGRLGPERTAPLLAALAGALAAAHAAGVLHRDVKPGNVLLGRDGAIRLTDFGIASLLSGRMRRTLFGTPGYIAPEALRGEGFDRAADLFALGAVGYRCLAGAPAFAGNTTKEILWQTVRRDPRPLPEMAPDVPAALAGIVTGLLEKDPQRRPSDAGQVARSLQAIIDAHGWRWRPPEPAAAVAAAAAANASANADGDRDAESGRPRPADQGPEGEEGARGSGDDRAAPHAQLVPTLDPSEIV